MDRKREGVLRRYTDGLVGATLVAPEGSGNLQLRGAHAAVFDQPTWISLGWGAGYVERIAPTGFDDVLGDPALDCRCLLNHDKNYLLARTTNQTLRLSTDKVGLSTDADFVPTTYARDLAALMDAKTLTQMSFAFSSSARGESWDTVSMKGPDGKKVTVDRCTINSFDGLYDVSPVTFPAYSTTDVGKRFRALSDEGDLLVPFDILFTRELDERELRELDLLELYVQEGLRST